jgi:hypothetical protein
MKPPNKVQNAECRMQNYGSFSLGEKHFIIHQVYYNTIFSKLQGVDESSYAIIFESFAFF